MDSLSALLESPGGGPTVVVVHSPRRRTADLQKPARVLPKARDLQDERNYLPGGPRQHADLVKAQARELRTANSALAGELLRSRQESEREICSLRNEVADLRSKLKADSERVAMLKERLAAEGLARERVEGAHRERVLELQKRAQAEHLLRAAAEAELARSQDKAGNVAVHLRGVEHELQGALREAGAARDSCLELETALNAERRARTEQQGELEAARAALMRERQKGDAHARGVAELEATIRTLTERNSALFQEERESQDALASAVQARTAAEAAGAKQRQELRLLGEQLEATKRSKTVAMEDCKQMQARMLDMEAAAALSIAKHAHYDDLKADYDAATARLKDAQSSWDKAHGEVKSLTSRLEEATALACKVPSLESRLATVEGMRKALEEQLIEAQAAAELLVSTVQEKDSALKKLQDQLGEAQRSAEMFARSKAELGQQATERASCAEALRAELQGLHEEANNWRRHHKELQKEAEAYEMELARREFKIKELTDALHLLSSKVADEQAAAAHERWQLEGLVKSIEAQGSQTAMELARCKDDLRSTEQAQTAARAELAAAQEECTQLRGQLHEEQLRATKLRGDLASLASSHGREMERKGQAVAEVLTRLQAEEGSRQAAQQESKALRRRCEELEAALTEAGEARARSAEAHEASQAALESMKRKLEIYKKENSSLLRSYDDYLQTLTKR